MRTQHRPYRNRPSSAFSIWAALIGNILVAVSKVTAVVLTGSSAMLSEAIHSFADTSNEILLLYGISRANRKPDTDHPFGYGREVYFWSFLVSLLMFALGAGVSIYEGIGRIRQPVPIVSPAISYGVLALAFVLEGGSLLVSLRQLRRERGATGFLDALKQSKDPPSFITVVEDSMALLGIFIAAGATFAATSLGRPEFDGIASVAIGMILAMASLFLARESKSLLIGEQAHPAVRKSILEIVNQDASTLKANGLFTVQLGPDHIVAMLSLEFADHMNVPQIEKEVARLEEKVRQANPEVVAVFIKLQTEETFEQHRNHLRKADAEKKS